MNRLEIKILLVEDDEDDYVITRDLLNEIEGVKTHIDWLGDCEAAMATLSRNEHDVCLLDYRLGRRDGIELLRQAQQNGCTMPIVLLTGQDSREVDMAASAAGAAGAADYLVKTHISGPLLERSIRYAIERKLAQEELRQAHDDLERRVQERTSELAQANEALRIQDIERQMAMGALRQAMEAQGQAKEEAEKANAAKDEFLSRMSHELRTPLNAVLGFGQLLESEPLTPFQAESIGHILKAGQHLLHLVDEVLDITHIQSGALPLSLEPVRVSQTVEESIAQIQPLTTTLDIKVEAEPQKLDVCVLADRQRLGQVVLNLLSNAVKYNRSGGSVHLSGQVDSGFFELSITDTGRGIAPENLPRLFTPFDRLGAEQWEIEGTGVGLILTQGLVKAMGGEVEVSSTLGEGTQVRVRLPLIEEPIPNAPASLESEISTAIEDKPSRSAQQTVLYIEDNAPNLSLVERILRRRPSIKLLSAKRGHQGIELACEYKPSLILLDLHLPDINGLEVLSRFQNNAVTQDIPVVVVSADATPAQLERLLSQGARDYLTKPFNVQKFLGVVDDILESSALSGPNA